MNENSDYFEDIVGSVRQSSLQRLFDIVAQNCVDYRADTILFHRISKKISQVHDSEQILVVNRVVEQIIAAALGHHPMTTREFEYCLNSEVEKVLRQEQEAISMEGFNTHVIQVYETGIDGNLHVSQQIPTEHMLDSDGNKVLYQLRKNERITPNRKELSKEYFAERVWGNSSAAQMLMKVLHGYVLSKISSKSKHTPYTWGHLYHTLYGLGIIIFCEGDKEQARALYSAFYGVGNITLNRIHCSIKNRAFPKGKYTEWNKQSADYAICTQIAEWLGPVMEVIECHENLLNDKA